MDYKFFESSLYYNWDMDVIDRSFDNEKVEKYLSLLFEPDKSFVEDIINKTRYVDFITFKRVLLNSLDKFKEEIGNEPFYLMLPTDKIGSEHWLTALLWYELRTMNIIKIIDETPELSDENINNILIIDDAIYTGINTFNKIDNVTYKLGKTLGISHREAGKFIKFHFVIPFMSNEGSKFIIDNCIYLNCGYNMYGIYYLPGLKDLMNIKDYYAGDYEKILRERFSISIDFDTAIGDMPAVYFDHKVAAPESTFSSIYLWGKLPNSRAFGSLFKNNPSRIKIEELSILYNNLI